MCLKRTDNAGGAKTCFPNCSTQSQAWESQRKHPNDNDSKEAEVFTLQMLTGNYLLGADWARCIGYDSPKSLIRIKAESTNIFGCVQASIARSSADRSHVVLSRVAGRWKIQKRNHARSHFRIFWQTTFLRQFDILTHTQRALWLHGCVWERCCGMDQRNVWVLLKMWKCVPCFFTRYTLVRLGFWSSYLALDNTWRICKTMHVGNAICGPP